MAEFGFFVLGAVVGVPAAIVGLGAYVRAKVCKCDAQCVKGGGVRKMFFSETTKGLFWSIGSSYWMFNLGVHI